MKLEEQLRRTGLIFVNNFHNFVCEENSINIITGEMKERNLFPKDDRATAPNTQSTQVAVAHQHYTTRNTQTHGKKRKKNHIHLNDYF